MDRCDALIVGGGPAGSSCALALRRAGMDVVVLDKSSFPRNKPCAGWITPPVVGLLQLDLLDYQSSRVLQPITGFSVGRLGGPMVQTHYGSVVSYGIRRCEFDHYLLARTQARMRLGESVESLERVNGSWRINGQIETPIVVGAGGHFCPVARFLGAKTSGPATIVAAQEVEFELTDAQLAECRVRPDVPELYFCRDLQGYGWCFRKQHYLNIGLGREDSNRLSQHVRDFVEYLHQTGRIPREIPDRFLGHAYALYGHSTRELIGDGMLLVGDAAALAAPYSGEGIRTAVESGLLAADTIVSSAGRYDRDSLQQYVTGLVSRFGSPQSSDGWLAHVPLRFKLGVAGVLFASTWFTRHVVLGRWFLSPSVRHRATFAGSIKSILLP